MNNKVLFILTLFVATLSCKTHIESVTPEYPTKVYELICQQVDVLYLDEIQERYKNKQTFVLRFHIVNDEIVEVKLLSKFLDDDFSQKFENALINKQVNFNFLNNKGKNIHVSGLIKFKKLCKICHQTKK